VNLEIQVGRQFLQIIYVTNIGHYIDTLQHRNQNYKYLIEIVALADC